VRTRISSAIQTHYPLARILEAFMSKPDGVSARPIPTGILVRDEPRPREPLVLPKLALPARCSPWLWVVTAASLAWALVIMTIAIRAGGKEIEPPRESELVVSAASAPVAAQVVEESPIDVAPDVPVMSQPPGPVLPMRKMPIADDAEMPPEIIPEPEPTPLPAAKPAVIAQPKRPAKDIDLKVYANCASIGTDVLFLKDPTEAFRRAKAEKKLVYMMHLSGNLEDPGFT
jgi:hypothetical protein